MDDRKAYLILGHGSENIRDERKSLPEGITLITTTECGMTVQDDEVYSLIDELKKSPESALNPILLPEDIRNKLRIYNSGEEYPTLEVSLLSDFQSNKDPNKLLLDKSGVFPIPLPFDEIVSDAGFKTDPALCKLEGGCIDNTTGVIDRAISGSVFKPHIEMIERIKDPKVHGNFLPLALLRQSYPISTIFEKVGPGTYYFPVCRAVMLPVEAYRYLENTPSSNVRKNIATLMDKVPTGLKSNLEKITFTVGQIRSHSNPRSVHPEVSGGAGGVSKGGARRLTRKRKVVRKTKRLYRRRKT